MPWRASPSRKLRTVIGNCNAVLAINLLAAAQAIDWRVGMNVSPNAPTTKMNEVGAVADKLGAAEREFEQFVEVVRMERRDAIAQKLAAGTRAAYLRIREVIEPLTKDRVLEADIRAIRRTLADDSLLRACSRALRTSHLLDLAAFVALIEHHANNRASAQSAWSYALPSPESVTMIVNCCAPATLTLNALAACPPSIRALSYTFTPSNKT